METPSPPPALTNGNKLHFAAMEAPPPCPALTNGNKNLPSAAMETPPPSPALTNGNKLPSAAMEAPPPSPALTNGKKLHFAAMVPHILLVSIPAPGHILPFNKFAHKLVASGYKVTCVSTGHVFENLQHGGHVQGKGTNVTTQRIRFQPLLGKEDEVPTVKLETMKDWMQKLSDKEMQVKLEEFIERLSPTPCCIVADMFLGWVQDAADKFGIPKHTLFTMPASTLASALMASVLVEQGKLPFRGDDRQDFILLPGSITLYVEDIWDSLKEPDHQHFDFHFKNIRRLSESDTIFVNTFEELESSALESMRSDMFAANVKVPRLVPIGPMVPDCAWEGEALAVDYDNEKSEAERWLDTQDAYSVLYISFGSLATISSEEQVRELALALEASPYPFLWVYRPPGLPQVNKILDSAPPTGKECIPPGFEERTRGHGMLIKGWAPQLQILLHKSTGAFLSHCGWNSTLESMCTGVPMLTWPFWADQKKNTRFIVDTAKIGLRFNQEADGMIKQTEIERVVAQMMDGEEGKSARRNMLELQQLARSAVADGGSSRTNFEKSLNNICPMPTSMSSCKCTKPKVQTPQV